MLHRGGMIFLPVYLSIICVVDSKTAAVESYHRAGEEVDYHAVSSFRDSGGSQG